MRMVTLPVLQLICSQLYMGSLFLECETLDQVSIHCFLQNQRLDILSEAGNVECTRMCHLVQLVHTAFSGIRVGMFS